VTAKPNIALANTRSRLEWPVRPAWVSAFPVQHPPGWSAAYCWEPRTRQLWYAVFDAAEDGVRL
jgi:hypothetical protein